MKHLKTGKKFSRKKDQRQAMLRILTGELLMRKKIKTTEVKAKEVKRLIDKIAGKIKLAAKGEKISNLAALRSLKAELPRNINSQKFIELGSLFGRRQSGFARVTKLGPRKSDGARMAVLELVEDSKK